MISIPVSMVSERLLRTADVIWAADPSYPEFHCPIFVGTGKFVAPNAPPVEFRQIEVTLSKDNCEDIRELYSKVKYLSWCFQPEAKAFFKGL